MTAKVNEADFIGHREYATAQFDGPDVLHVLTLPAGFRFAIVTESDPIEVLWQLDPGTYRMCFEALSKARWPIFVLTMAEDEARRMDGHFAIRASTVTTRTLQ